MNNFSAILILLPLIIIFVLIAPILIGIYVFRDAKRLENGDPLLWALVAALTPFYIGLFAYVLINSDKKRL